MVSKTGELTFKEQGDGGEPPASQPDDDGWGAVLDTRSRTEDEISSMIDGASAILSQGGGTTFSVKSRSFMASLASVRTPRSKISQASIVSSSMNR